MVSFIPDAPFPGKCLKAKFSAYLDSWLKKNPVRSRRFVVGAYLSLLEVWVYRGMWAYKACLPAFTVHHAI